MLAPYYLSESCHSRFSLSISTFKKIKRFSEYQNHLPDSAVDLILTAMLLWGTEQQ